MGSIGFGEIAFLVVLALLIFGPDKLPGMANSLGKALSTLRREASGTLDELKRAADAEDLRELSSELRAASGELRDARAGLRRGFADLATGGGAAAAASASANAPAAVGDSGPPPFDPDAT